MEKIREHIKVQQERAILVGAYPKDKNGQNKNDNLAELTALAESAGAIVVGRLQQRLSRINPSTYIGKGKAEYLSQKVQETQANLVIFDNDLTPGQIRELEKIVKVRVLDRSELILDIFATRAQTKQAKLQVELAQLEYTYPRLTRMWSHLDNVAGAGGGTAAGAVGGIGTRGTGEKQLEIDRRLVSKRITDLKRELAEIDRRILREIAGRKDFFKICLVGYTNAGKSTLLNALTGADVLVEDRLFATLDTRTRKWRIDGGLEVLLSDTVGFVSKLPHHLVASFKATLEEAVHADLLLHVADASSPEAFDQIQSVQKVLEEIGCGGKPVLLLLNKCDRIADGGLFDSLQSVYPDALCISARSGLNLDLLAQRVLDYVKGQNIYIRLRCAPSEGRIITFLRTHAAGLKECYDEQGVLLEGWLGRNQLPHLRHLGAQPEEVCL
ncbi:MAG TPA: GTPase HflX [Anaerohalosphaeraceae bacterium]|nr:GTPase HflX [Anaerohalosphaeraceae bacterium]HOL87840.1 GTPase HflX [Anaerohalosphaeraceae bacterium]HPP55192.1 GTPase HflX [Anaerohalosphaeraceae bacterium]